MIPSRLIFSICILLFYSSLRAQPARLAGSGSGYEGRELRFFIEADPVTKRLKPLFRQTCDDHGTFSCEIPLAEYGTVYIKAGIYTFYLHIKSGSDYVISLPPFTPRPAGEDDNPFFVETRVIPEVTGDTNDINNFIRLFDREFNPIFNMVAERVALNYRVTELNSEIAKLNGIAAKRSDDFCSDFVQFRLMMLNNVASGTYPGRIEDSALINRQFLVGNPAYLDLIEQKYAGFLRKLATGPSGQDYFRAMSSGSPGEIRTMVSQEARVANPQLLDYIILLNLYSEFYESSASQKEVIMLMLSLRSEGSSDYIKGLASALTEDLLSLLPGTKPPVFSLRSSTGNLISNTQFAGKFLLLSFSRSDDSPAAQEYSVLKMWYSEYSSDLEVVTILKDRNFEEGVDRMKKYGFNWIILDGSDSDMLDYSYNIKMYPSFMLIDREGNIISAACPLPTENLETWIRNIMRQDK